MAGHFQSIRPVNHHNQVKTRHQGPGVALPPKDVVLLCKCCLLAVPESPVGAIDFKEPLLLLLGGQGALPPREDLTSVSCWVINKLS